MSSNPYEEKSRARKAFKVSRVLLRLVDDTDVSVDDLGTADEAFRKRVGNLAGTRVPSEKTWEIAVDLVRTELSFRESEDPFPRGSPTPG